MAPLSTLPEAPVADSMILADTAIISCPDLPLVVGLPGMTDPRVGWRDLDEAAITQRCADDPLRVVRQSSIFSEKSGRQPRHQIEIGPVLDLFYPPDWYGVVVDITGDVAVVAVPGGACDLG